MSKSWGPIVYARIAEIYVAATEKVRRLTRVACRTIRHALLILLCYKRCGRQKGQQGSCRMMAVAMTTRRDAIEKGL